MAKFDKNTFIEAAARGRYNGIIAYLEGLEDGAEMLAEYKAVFEGGKYRLNVDNAEVTQILHAYEDCLKWVWTNKRTTTKEHQRYIVDKLKPFFPRARFYARISTTFAFYALLLMVSRFIRKRGYLGKASSLEGRFIISIWGKETKRMERVELPEGTIEIEVTEIDEVITKCAWSYVLMDPTEGIGGWVTKKGCSYYKDSYEYGTDEYASLLCLRPQKADARHVAQDFWR